MEEFIIQLIQLHLLLVMLKQILIQLMDKHYFMKIVVLEELFMLLI